MYYEGEDNILSFDETQGLARQGMYPAESCELPNVHPEFPTKYPEMDFTEEDLARIDKARDSDVNTPAPSPPLPLIGPLTYTNTLREAAKKKTGFYPRPWQIAVAWAVYYGTCDALVVTGAGYGRT